MAAAAVVAAALALLALRETALRRVTRAVRVTRRTVTPLRRG